MRFTNARTLTDGARDAARLLGVSHQRVHQLAREKSGLTLRPES